MGGALGGRGDSGGGGESGGGEHASVHVYGQLVFAEKLAWMRSRVHASSELLCACVLYSSRTPGNMLPNDVILETFQALMSQLKASAPKNIQ